MGRADQTLEQYAVSCGDDDDVASARATNKLPAQTADATSEIDAADVLEALDVAPRPSPRANETQEIRAIDILEETPAPVEVPIEVEAPRVEHSSIAPMAYDVPSVRRWNEDVRRAEPTFHIEPTRAPKRLMVYVLGAMGASILILGVAALRAFLHTSDVDDGMPPVAAAPIPMPAQPAHAPIPAATATPAPTDATPSSTGTVVLARGVKRVTVDGTRITASAIVPCGKHAIAVGRRTREADVPCGGMYLVTP